MALRFDLTMKRRDFVIKAKGEFPNGITGIMGPSGAGKSSFFAMLSGLEKPEEGYVMLNGRYLTHSSRETHIPGKKRKVGLVFQDMHLFPHMTVEGNLRFGMKYNASGGAMTYERIVDLMQLNHLEKSYPGEISGGEQRRTALGRVLLTQPELLLLDEPFNGIDRAMRDPLLDSLKLMGEQLSIPILVVSHDREDIRMLTERCYMMESGRLHEAPPGE